MDGEISKTSRHSLVDRENEVSGKKRIAIAKDVLGLDRRLTERRPKVAALFMDKMAGFSLLNEMHLSIRAQIFNIVSSTIMVISNIYICYLS